MFMIKSVFYLATWYSQNSTDIARLTSVHMVVPFYIKKSSVYYSWYSVYNSSSVSMKNFPPTLPGAGSMNYLFGRYFHKQLAAVALNSASPPKSSGFRKTSS
jgi:hypothetical protein